MKRITTALLISGLAASMTLGLTLSASADDACKKKGACPLHDWMESNLQPATKKKDTKAMAGLLSKVAKMAPKHWSGGDKETWAKFAHDGSAAAESGDYKLARKSCKGCHKKFRKPYKAHDRARGIHD